MLLRIGVDARVVSWAMTGIGRYTAELAREFAQLDVECRWYLPNRPVSELGAGPRSRIRFAGCRNRVSAMVWSQTCLPHWARRDRVDVFWGTTHRLPRLLPASIARVVTIHDLVWKQASDTMRPLSRWMDSKLMPQAVRSADRVIAVSHSTAEAIASEWPGTRDKIRVVPLGVRRFAADDASGSLVDLGIVRPYVLFVGTLEPRKNLRRLLAAWMRLPAGLRSAYQLVIAGGAGWGDFDLSGMVSRESLANEVVLAGFVPDERMAALYANSYMLAMPSLYEGFGLPLLEAMSFGKPVLTSGSSSMPEVAGAAGRYVDPLDEGSIADGLLELLSDETCYMRLAAAASGVAAGFSWHRAALMTLEVMQEAYSERRQRMGFAG